MATAGSDHSNADYCSCFGPVGEGVAHSNATHSALRCKFVESDSQTLYSRWQSCQVAEDGEPTDDSTPDDASGALIIAAGIVAMLGIGFGGFLLGRRNIVDT